MAQAQTFSDVQPIQTPPQTFSDVQPIGAEPEKPWYQRAWNDLFKSSAELKKEVPQVSKETSEAGLESASRFAAPGSTTPLPNAISEASSAAALTAPRAIGEAGGVTAVGAISDAARAAGMKATEIPGIVRDAAGRLLRDPDVLEYPKTAKSLRAPVKAAASVGKVIGGPEIANAIIPAHPEAPQGPYAKIPVRVPRNVIAARAAAAAKIAEQVPEDAAPAATVYPEPRAAGPTERPGAMYSVPRDQLPGLAASGAPGAADVLRATGQPVIYEPRGGTGYGGPRQTVQTPAEFAAQASSAVSQQPSVGIVRDPTTGQLTRQLLTSGGEQVAPGQPAAPTNVSRETISGQVLPNQQTTAATEIGNARSVAEFIKQKRASLPTQAILNRMDRATIESNRLDLGELTNLEKHYVADTMETKNYAKLSDAGKKQLLLSKIGGRL